MVQTPAILKPEPDRDRGHWPPLAPGERPGVLWRRMFAYMADVCVIGLLWLVAYFVALALSIVSFGLLSASFALLVLVPAGYHVLTVGLLGATLGQSLLGLAVWDRTGSRPSILQALVLTAAFYLTVPTTGGLALLAVFVIPGRRTLHDAVSGTVVTRRGTGPAAGWVQ